LVKIYEGPHYEGFHMYKPREEDRLLTTGEAAEFLNYTVASLERGRCKGYGPPYIKIGRIVRYRLGDLIAYRDARRIDPCLGAA
jgi:hypothetical protein